MRRVLLIDNYDSFTLNLLHRLVEADERLVPGRTLRVERNDAVTAAEAARWDPTHIVVSPGPCTPRESGVSMEVLRALAGRVPILGVCLGHQCLAELFGMRVVRSADVVHGKTSPVEHDGRTLFAGIASPMTAARYHSLIVAEETVASDWEVSAWCAGTGGERIVMGLRKVWSRPGRAALEGVQFHPESYMTPDGLSVLRNFLDAR